MGKIFDSTAMFPTSVGMNRLDPGFTDDTAYVPHIRGDEPNVKKTTFNVKKCSPHPWG